MKIKEGFELMEMCGENVIISHGRENINFTKVITLNESAADIWNALYGREFTLEDAVAVIMENYEVDEATAKADCKKLLDDWLEVGFAE